MTYDGRTSKNDAHTDRVSLLFWLKIVLICGLNQSQNLVWAAVGQCFEPETVEVRGAYVNFLITYQ